MKDLLKAYKEAKKRLAELEAEYWQNVSSMFSDDGIARLRSDHCEASIKAQQAPLILKIEDAKSEVAVNEYAIRYEIAKKGGKDAE